MPLKFQKLFFPNTFIKLKALKKYINLRLNNENVFITHFFLNYLKNH